MEESEKVKDAAIEGPDEVMDAAHNKFFRDFISQRDPREIFRESVGYPFVTAGLILFSIKDEDNRRLVFDEMLRTLVAEFVRLKKLTCEPDSELSELMAKYHKSE